MWSKRERVMAVLSGERPDRVPIFECMASDGVLEHFGGKGPIAPGDFEAVVSACSRCLDLCHPALVPQAPARVERDGALSEVAERWNTWRIPVSFADEQARARDMEAAIDAAEAWYPPAATAEDFRRSAASVNAVAGEMVYINLGTSCAVLPYDIEQGIYAYADQPELTRRWNRAMNKRQLRWLDAIAGPDSGPVCICWNDVACKGRLLYAPDILEDFFYPHLAAQVELLHARGIKVLFHSDGDVTDALPRLVDCGIDGFNPLEISAGMSPNAFREICGARVALVGGIDAVTVLAHGTPKQVAEETIRLMDLFRDTGNLMVASASGQVDNSMPTENVRTMYETVWQYGRY